MPLNGTQDNRPNLGQIITLKATKKRLLHPNSSSLLTRSICHSCPEVFVMVVQKHLSKLSRSIVQKHLSRLSRSICHSYPEAFSWLFRSICRGSPEAFVMVVHKHLSWLSRSICHGCPEERSGTFLCKRISWRKICEPFWYRVLPTLGTEWSPFLIKLFHHTDGRLFITYTMPLQNTPKPEIVLQGLFSQK